MGKKRRQPSLPKVRSLLDRYRQQTGRHIAAIEIDDPYAAPQHETAALVARPGRAADNPDAPREWLAPKQGRIKVMASTRDVVTGMFARRQIDEASFLAARNYQRLHERAGQLGSVRSLDLSAPQVSGRRSDDFEHVDVQLRAVHELQHVEAQLMHCIGEEGVLLLRDVLGRGIAIDLAARERGETTKDRWWGGLFRRSLRHLAEITGFAVHGAYRRIEQQARQQREAEKKRERRHHVSEDPSPASA
jgi:hypothetical protein